MYSRYKLIAVMIALLVVIADAVGFSVQSFPQIKSKLRQEYPERAISPAKVQLSSLVPAGWQVGTGTNVLDHRVRGDGETNDAPAIQAVIDGLQQGGTVYFPKAVYIAKNIVLRPGVTLNFEPGAVLKFPPGSDGTDRMIIVGELDGSKITDTDKEYSIIGNGLVIDATNLSDDHTCYGIFISGASNFRVQDVQGYGFKNGYLVEIIRSYGSVEKYPRNGKLRNIRNFGDGWGCIAVETGYNLSIEDVYSDTNGVNIECDVDVMGHGVLAVRDVEVKNVVTSGGITLNINAHQAVIEHVTVNGLQNSRGTLVGLYADTTPGHAGSIHDVVIEAGFGNGGGTTDNGIESPNDVVVENLVLRDIDVQNYREFGFKCNGGEWYNCSARNNGLSGWKSTMQPGGNVPVARFVSCSAINNNGQGAVNHSGWNYANHSRLEFVNCTGTDTRENKRQWYAVYTQADVIATECSFDGNKVGGISPMAKVTLF